MTVALSYVSQSRVGRGFELAMTYRIIGNFIVLMFVAGCSTYPHAIGIESSARPVSSVSGNTIHKVFVATNRAEADDTAELFSGERAGKLAFASMRVSVPPRHEPGNIERASTLPPDPRRHFVIVDPKIYGSSGKFVSDINSELAKRPPDQREILLFVHGYNTRLSDAVLRLAQFVNDTGFSGVPMLFSWPSRGETRQYVYDLNSAFLSRDALEQTGLMLNKTIAREATILAHSMGNILTVETMRQMYITGKFNRSGRVRNVILADADIDIDLFKSQIQRLPRGKPTIFVLVSKDDRALKFSRRIAGKIDRVGASDPAQFENTGVIVIDLTKIDDRSSFNHTKFADSPDVVKLIGEEMKVGADLSTTRPTIGGSLPIQITVN